MLDSRQTASSAGGTNAPCTHPLDRSSTSNRDIMQTSNMSANLDMPLDAIIAQNQTGRKGGGKGRGRGKGGSGCVIQPACWDQAPGAFIQVIAAAGGGHRKDAARALKERGGRVSNMWRATRRKNSTTTHTRPFPRRAIRRNLRALRSRYAKRQCVTESGQIRRSRAQLQCPCVVEVLKEACNPWA